MSANDPASEASNATPWMSHVGSVARWLTILVTLMVLVYAVAYVALVRREVTIRHQSNGQYRSPLQQPDSDDRKLSVHQPLPNAPKLFGYADWYLLAAKVDNRIFRPHRWEAFLVEEQNDVIVRKHSLGPFW
jgi:hypothetical protein